MLPIVALRIPACKKHIIVIVIVLGVIALIPIFVGKGGRGLRVLAEEFRPQLGG